MTTHPLLSGRQQMLVLGIAAVLIPLGIGTNGSPRPNRITAAVTPPPCTAPPTNQPWTTPADLLSKNPDGSWKIPWATVEQFLQTLTLMRTLGEQNHLLRPVDPNTGGVRASIFPFQGTGELCMDAFKKGVVVAKIEADGDYRRLGLARGNNYYVVYRVERTWHPLVIGPAARTELKRFVYKSHRPVARGYERSAFTRAAYECAVILKLKACFVDSPRAHIAPGSGRPRGGLLFTRLFGWLFRQDGGSQPWAACPQFGCCCGGSNCHPE